MSSVHACFILKWTGNLTDKFLKTDIAKQIISQEVKRILPSCKKHWKAYLILL